MEYWQEFTLLLFAGYGAVSFATDMHKLWRAFHD